ncbi:probable F420-dependent oxidoreductase [Jatrophihabitans sp. GAS493]|uniref:LLM class F420-dependent oxidoreductase n=1 Tax=Jatrophihabitans sp. GAS493 TaxID=1907575 RepID=UPI000BC0341D|nr:LLM class F420-dependent oxidoreductase [Jatrophihabitans sp. GAS493]SOD72130.1 probable F420-dependent oxidoreductase [Jatrophihabitans sp. GAS493]
MAQLVRRLGMTLPFGDDRLDVLPAVLAKLAAAGYSDAWTSELAATDAFAPLLVSALSQPQLQLGTSIAGVFSRSPALLAMNALAVAELSPHPVHVGVGASSKTMVEGWHGAQFVKPFERVRDTVRFLRLAFTGERVSYRGDTFSIDGFRLDRAPERRPRVLVAALRERMLRLAGQEADGVILNWLSPADVARVVPYVLDHNPGGDVVARLFVVAGDDVAFARDAARRHVTAYLNTGVYAAYQQWLGRGPALEAMWQAWRAGDRAAALAAVPESVVDELFITGDADAVWSRTREYVAAGVTVPVLSIGGPRDVAWELAIQLGQRFAAESAAVPQ